MTLLKKFLFKPLSRWLLVALWASLIFFLSSLSFLPKSEIIWWDYIIKKSAHIFVFAVLNFLLIFALSPRISKFNDLKKSSPRIFIIALVLAVLYGISDEFHQSFTPGRTAKATDVAFDTFGALTSSFLTRYYYK